MLNPYNGSRDTVTNDARKFLLHRTKGVAILRCNKVIGPWIETAIRGIKP
jgi:hypothetical protein